MADLAQVRSNFIGLTTARSPEATPEGGLLEAENVVLRSQNEIAPRPGFSTAALPAALSGEALARVEFPIEFNEAGLMVDAGGPTRWDGHSASSGPVVTEAFAELTWESYAGVVARRSLFICAGDQLRAVHAPNAATAYRAGAPAPVVVKALSSVPALTGPAFKDANYYRAYRAVTRRDEKVTGQSHIVRSAPSNRLFVYEATVDRNALVTVSLHDGEDWLPGDVIELYGTEAIPTYPTDEMYLITTVTLAAADITAKYIEILDDKPNRELGMQLYTNESREGAEGAHFRPPMAGCVGVFNDSLWLGDLTYPAALQFRVRIRLPDTAIADTSVIGARAITGTVTNGSATVTVVGAADIAELKVGMIISRVGASYGSGWNGGSTLVRVTSIGATSFVVTQTWGGATAAHGHYAEDSILVGSEWYPARYLVDALGTGSAISGVSGRYPAGPSALYTATYTSDVFGYPSTFVDAETREFVLSTIMPTTAAPQVWATNGALYTPALPEPTIGSGYQMQQDILTDGVAWSNAGEPEHFRLDNIDQVGGEGSTVMALGRSRTALLIATDRGMWRGFGHADSSISFDELDGSVRALGRRCMDAVGSKQYVAADDGVYECDENSCENITIDTVSDMDVLFKIVSATRASKLKVVANAKDDEILVCCPVDAGTGNLTRLYVFNTHTRAWTKWVLPSITNDITVKGPARLIYALVDGAETELVESATNAESSVLSVVVSAVSGLTVTILAGSGWIPAVGDAVIQSAVTYRVTAVASATVFTVHQTGVSSGGGFAFLDAYVAFMCTITPSVNTLKVPHFMKVWGEGVIRWTRRSGVYAYGLAFRSAITGASTAAPQTRILDATPTTNTDARSAPCTSRFITDRAAARGTHLCFSVTVRQALADWAIEGVSVRARTTADKAPARLS